MEGERDWRGRIEGGRRGGRIFKKMCKKIDGREGEREDGRKKT